MQVNQIQKFFGLGAARGAVNTAHFKAKGNVFPNRHQWEQGKILENQRCGTLIGPRARHVLATDQHLAFGGIHEARNQPQDGGLAAARWPQKRKKFTGLDGDVNLVNSTKPAEIH